MQKEIQLQMQVILADADTNTDMVNALTIQQKMIQQKLIQFLQTLEMISTNRYL